MNNLRTLFTKPCHFQILRRSTVTLLALVALTSSKLAFGGEIHDAAAKGDLGRVTALLKNNPGLVASTNSDGWTPLHVVAADEGIQEPSPLAGFYHVIDSSNAIPTATFLMANGADVNAKDNKGCTPLYYAVKKGKKPMVDLLLLNNADVNAKENKGETPLLLAVKENRKDMVALLIANKADVNAKSSDGVTSLHWAAIQGNKDMVDLLLASNAIVDAKAKGGATPLDWAVARGNKDVTEILIAHKADVNSEVEGMTPMHIAAMTGQKDIAELLFANKANLDAVDVSGKTPLMEAAENLKPDLVAFLLKHGADKTAKSKEGKTALDYAKGKPEPKRLIIEQIDANTEMITDGFVYQKEAKGATGQLNITGFENGQMKATGRTALGLNGKMFDSGVGMTWVFTKSNIVFPNGNYIYTSLTSGASITFTKEGAILKSFRIDNPYKTIVEVLAK